jgi:hypothetical protein
MWLLHVYFFYPLPFALCPLPFHFSYLPSAVCRLPSAVCRLPSAVCRLPSAVCRLPFHPSKNNSKRTNKKERMNHLIFLKKYGIFGVYSQRREYSTISQVVFENIYPYLLPRAITE